MFFYKIYSPAHINTNNFLIKILKAILFLKYKHVIIILFDNICIINVESLCFIAFSANDPRLFYVNNSISKLMRSQKQKWSETYN